MAINFASAVILRHAENGAVGILGKGGGLSAEAVHILDYEGRRGIWEEKGGCEREATEQDIALLSKDTSHVLDYDARMGNFADKGKDRMIDATYFSQDGIPTRQELEADLMACGGAGLRSFVAVKREHAAELGITTKQDFERLLRNNWQDMMMQAGIAHRREDIHWYACYHTDAPESLHVHVYTWVANTPMQEGQTISALATRRQKAILYADAYARPRLKIEVEEKYLRSLLRATAKAELGIRIPEKDMRLLRLYAAEMGQEVPKLESTLDEKGQEAIAKKQERLVQELEGGVGHLWANYKAYAAAKDIVQELRVQSKQFGEIYDRAYKYINDHADMAGLAVGERKTKDQLIEELGKAQGEKVYNEQKIAQSERREHIDERVKRLNNYIAYPIMQNATPEIRMERDARQVAWELKQGLVKQALDKNNPLQLSQQEQSQVKAILKEALEYKGEDRTQVNERLDRAVLTIVQSPGCQERIDRGVVTLKEISEDYKDIPVQQCKEDLTKELTESLSNELRWRLDRGIVRPFGMEPREYAYNYTQERTRGLVYELVQTKGLSVGMNLHQYKAFSEQYGLAIEAAKAGRPEQATSICRSMAQIIVKTSVVQNTIDTCYHNAVTRYGEASAPTRDHIEKLVEAKIASQIDRAIQQQTTAQQLELLPQEQQRGLGIGDLGISMLGIQAVRELMRDRAEPVVAAQRAQEQSQSKHRKTKR